MTTTTVRSLLLSSALCLGSARAQDPSPGRPDPSPWALPPEALRVPIHTLPDDPLHGPYGTWAAGPGYKASFHDGFAFYPYLGSAHPENLPFAWRTESVAVGGEVLVAPATPSTSRHTDWRYEIRYPGLVEAYDVRTVGVEQTFTLKARPIRGGDWVVTGRVTTPLRAAPTPAAAHQELRFADAAGHARVSYGAATAVDAAGDRLPVPTSFDGERITLTVDGRWLAGARFPVVLDPVTAPVTIHGDPASIEVFDMGIGREYESSQYQVMVVFCRKASAGDGDAYGLLMNPDFSQPTLVFRDISSTLDTRHTRVAFVGGADRWVIAFQRAAVVGVSTTVRLWVHDKAVPSSAGGSLASLGLSAAGTLEFNPDVGGIESNQSPQSAFIVYQADIVSQPQYSEARGVLFNAATKTFGTSFVLSADGAAGTRYDREIPSVNKIARGSTDAWMVVWQERDRASASNKWMLRFQYFGLGGVRGARSHQSDGSYHVQYPRLDGNSGRYAVVYFLSQTELTAPTAPTARVTRFDARQDAFTFVAVRNFATATSGLAIYEPSIAFDTATRAHWVATYGEYGSPCLHSARAVRLGAKAGVVETVSLFFATRAGDPGRHVPAATFDTASHSFLVAYPAADTSQSVAGRRLIHDPQAVNVTYGTGCGGGIGGNPPYAGYDQFYVTMYSAHPSTPALLFMGFGPANLDLTAVGMPGCRFLLDPSFLVAFSTATNASGNAAVNVPLPDLPVFLGDLYFQWLYLQPGANPAGLLATHGLKAQVRV